jgi:TIR domain
MALSRVCGWGMHMKLFASYSRKDAGPAQEVIRDLELVHLAVWHDNELHGGDPWWQNILHHIREADVLLFALSDNSLRSKPCLAELSYAQTLGIPVLPVQIGPVEHLRTTPLADTQIIDYRERSVASGLALLAAIHDAAEHRNPLPDELPEPPPVPFEYLFRLGSAIGAAHLTPQEQADFIQQLRECLETEEDEGVREDARDLLVALRARPDVTHRIAQQLDTLLADLSGTETTASALRAVGRHRARSPRREDGARRTGTPPSGIAAREGTPGPASPRRRVTIVLGAVLSLLALAAVVTYVVSSGSGGSQAELPGGTPVGPSASGPTQPTPTAASTPGPTPNAAAVGVFTGRTNTAGIGLSIVVDSGVATAYVCDGQRLEAWLSGTVAGDAVQMSGEDNASLTGTLNQQGLSGTISTTAGQIPFLAGAAEPPAGVYRAEIQLNGVDTYIGWAVLADGSQLGVIATGDGGLPAPPLDLANATFQLNGQTYQAEPVHAGTAPPSD